MVTGTGVEPGNAVIAGELPRERLAFRVARSMSTAPGSGP
jgi:hypothetical protein